MEPNFFSDPPGWIQAMLWLSFVYVVFRTFAWSLLQSKLVRALLLARLHNVPVGLVDILLIFLRKSDPLKLIKAYITAQTAGNPVCIRVLEDLEKVGGDPEKVCGALLAARRAGLECTFEAICAAQLEGRDLSEFVSCSLQDKPESDCDPTPTPGDQPDRD